MKRCFFKVLAATVALGALVTPGMERVAHAEEIVLTGPLAGAPAVRKQRLYRQGRFEIAPSVSFTLLDEYQRVTLIGARLNYNLTDWLAIGGWGGISIAPLKFSTDLTDRIQAVNEKRIQDTAAAGAAGPSIDHKLTRINMSQDFNEQLGTIDWVAAPQLTLVPFRGKIGIFQSIYVDTDFYLFGGPAFVSRTERADCGVDGTDPCGPAGGGTPGSSLFPMDTTMTIAPTFGLGFQFYVSKWGAFGLEWRGLPFARNTGGFDNHGGGPNEAFPDLKVDDRDRELRFNQMITISFGVSLPFDYEVSE